jgi:hypothetical protein
MAKPKTVMIGKKKWYELDPRKHGVGGIQPHMPKPRKEDRRAKSWEGYAVVFFPQYDIGWKATVSFHSTLGTLSQTPEAARVRYADNIGGPDSPDKKWAQYHHAGHRVRRIKIIDLGPA